MNENFTRPFGECFLGTTEKSQIEGIIGKIKLDNFWVVETQIFFYVHPYLGKMIQFD